MIPRSIPSRVPRTPPGRATRVFSPGPETRQDRRADADSWPEPAPRDPPDLDGPRLGRLGQGILLFATLALTADPAGAQGTPTASEALTSETLSLELHHGKRRTTAARVEDRLGTSVRRALNDWAGLIQAHELSVAVPAEANAVLLGTLPAKELSALARHLDETFALLEDLQPADHEPAEDDAVVGFVFDAEGLHGAPLAGLVEELVARRLLDRGGAAPFLARPGGVSLRQASLFIQPGYDVAGDAAAGDDEFRLANAVCHQAVQAVVTARFGQLPKPVLWGLGFVAEQRQFQSLYHFDARGFVAAADHHAWPAEARELVEAGQLDVASCWLDDSEAGRRTPAQLLTWAQLDELLHADRARLSALLGELGALHDAAHPFGGGSRWQGDPTAARALIDEHVATRSSKTLRKHLRRLR